MVIIIAISIYQRTNYNKILNKGLQMKTTKTFFIVIVVGLLLCSCSESSEKRGDFHKAIKGTWWADEPFTQYTFKTQWLYIATDDRTKSYRWIYVDKDDNNPYLIELRTGQRRGILIKFLGGGKIEITDKGSSRKFEKR